MGKGVQLTQLELDTARAAIAALGKLLQKADEPEKTILLSDAISKYLEQSRHLRRERTMGQKASVLKRFASHAGDIDITAVTVDIIQAFLDTLRSKDRRGPISYHGFNANLREIAAVFAWCAEEPREWLAKNPARLIPIRDVPNDGIRILSCDQAESLMRYLEREKPALVRYYCLALFAGIRPNGELERIAERPELVDEQNGVVHVHESISKIGKRRQVVIRPNLAKWLERYQGPILPTNHNRDRQTLRRQFGLSQDILRHTCISNLVSAEGSFAMAAYEMGNSETIIREHYFRVVTKEDASRFWAISPAELRQPL